MKLLLDFLKNEEGQTSTEYIMLLAVVALLVMKFKDVASSRLQAITGSVFDKADGILNGIQ